MIKLGCIECCQIALDCAIRGVIFGHLAWAWCDRRNAS
jgi:hypothetical protein